MVDGKGILDTLLGAAASAQGKPGAGSSGGLEDILGQVLGGSAQSQAGGQGGGIGSILGQILGGSAQSQGGGLGSILGQVLGGGSQQQAGHQQTSGGSLGELLGQVLGGGSQPQAGQQQTSGGLGDIVGQVLGGAASSSGGLVDAIKNVVANNPGLAGTAAISMAGLMLGSSRARGLAMGAAKLGGIALIGSLGYHALKNYQAKIASSDPSAAAALPQPHEYTPVATSSEGALLLVRAMIAAATADGQVDDEEQRRIMGQMSDGPLSKDQEAWLRQEMSKPATVQQLASAVSSQQEAVEVYAAARIAIDHDSAANKAFLQNLANALTLPPSLVVELDKAVDGIKVDAAA